MTPAERVCERMRLWMDTTGIGQRQFAADLDKTQVWLQKILSGENHVRLRDLDRVAAAMRTTASELVRGEEDRYQLEATPGELRLIEKLRHDPESFASVAHLVGIKVITPAPTKPDSRRRNPSPFNGKAQSKTV